MNRFIQKFLKDLEAFSEEHGFIIDEGGIIQPIEDWISTGKPFKYTTVEEDGEVVITGVEMI